MPLELAAKSAVTPRKTSGPLLRLRSGVSEADRMAFTEQLALLLETGQSLTESLEALWRHAPSAGMRAVIEALVTDLGAGQSFSQALARHPGVFSSTYVNLVAASESGAFLHPVLAQLRAEDERRVELRRTLRSALAYPAFLSVFSLLIVVFVLVVVFPKFSALFVRIKDQLPMTTLGLMWLSDMLRIYWVHWLAGVSAAGYLFVRWLRGASGTDLVDRLKLRLPWLRDIFAQLYLTQSLRILSLSIGRGVPIIKALEACRDVVRNKYFRRLLMDAELRVTEGGTLSAAFSESAFVPDLAKQMIATGEASANLPLVMDRVSQHYERELTRRITAVGKMAEPVMLLVMGLVVGVIVSSLVLPIFKLSRAVG